MRGSVVIADSTRKKMREEGLKKKSLERRYAIQRKQKGFFLETDQRSGRKDVRIPEKDSVQNMRTMKQKERSL